MAKHITELVDIKRIQSLIEKFHTATGVSVFVLDREANILADVGWQDICTKFHRKNELTLKNCLESDTSLANDLETGKKYNVYKCLNGLIDVAVPIIVEGEHIGNLYSGQFLPQEPDKEYFRKQAKKYGFDEKEYLQALDKVPILTSQEVKKNMEFLSELAELIGDMGMNRLTLSEFTADLEDRVKERTKEMKDAQIATLNMMQDAEEARREAERANEQIRQQQAQLNSMFDGIEDVIYVADPDTYEVVYLNEVGRKIWGHDFKGKKCYRLLQNLESPCPFCTNDAILKDPGKAVIWEFQNKINKRWYRCFDKAIKWTTDNYVRFEMAVDITEIKDAQEAIKKEKEITESILDSIPGVFYQIGLDGKFIRTNKNFQKLLDKSEEEMQEISALSLFEGEDKEQIGAAMQQVFEEGFSDVEAYMVTTKGRIPFYFTGVLQEIDKMPYLIGVGSNITNIKETQQQLEEANKELMDSNKQLEQFAYVASHDLQEPLRKITSFTELFEKRYKDNLDEKADKYISYIVDGAKRMQRLIVDLLQYSRVTTRGNSFEPVRADDVLEEVLSNMQFSIKNSGAKIDYDRLPRVLADKAQLSQVFQNLIGNAIKFQKDEEPRITIKVKELNDAWQFSVEDNGIGIEDDYKERIFVIFQRLHARDKYPGTGIGLAVCKKIIERHNGEIWVDSTPGEGSTFYFILPKEQKKTEIKGEQDV